MMILSSTTLSLAVSSCRARPADDTATRYGLGHAATAAEIAARDVDAAASGHGLPPGHGSVLEGQTLFAAKCASCHGPNGEGKPPTYPALVGRDPRAERFAFGDDPTIKRTIGDYWPYATTVFDYIRRAMPQNAPGSLTNDEVYAITAYLLAANRVIAGTTTLDSATLVAVKMPAVSHFVKDDRQGARQVR
jgi:mono/diheme cytochrome c family protein